MCVTTSSTVCAGCRGTSYAAKRPRVAAAPERKTRTESVVTKTMIPPRESRCLRSERASAGKVEELQSLHFSRRALRQLGDETEALRRLVPAELGEAVRAQLFLRAFGAGLQHDAREDFLAVSRVWNADCRRLEHGPVLQQGFV